MMLRLRGPSRLLGWRFLVFAMFAQSVFAAPTSEVYLELADTFEESEFMLSGAATDTAGIALVTIAIQNQTSGLWLQRDGTWASGPVRLGTHLTTPPGAETVKWLFRKPLPQGDYLVDVRARNVSGIVQSAGEAAVGTFSVIPDRAPIGSNQRWLTIHFGRVQWGVAGQGGGNCAPYTDPVNGTVFLDETAEFLAGFGYKAQGSVPFGHLDPDPSVRNCPFRAVQSASLYDLQMLRDTYGWTFVGDGVGPLPSNPIPRPGMDSLSCIDQVTAAAGSLVELQRWGHHRGWGVFAGPNGTVTAQIRDTIVDPLYAFSRSYGNINQTEITQADALSGDWEYVTSVTGGYCNDPDADCFDHHIVNHVDRIYKGRDTLLPAMIAAPGNWRPIQFYGFVRGHHLPDGYPGTAENPVGENRETYWDCRSADPDQHWTSRGEVYCYNDFVHLVQTVHQNYPEIVTIDAAHAATTWGVGNPNHVATFPTCAGNVAPTASQVSIGGTAQVGQTLVGSYTYSDANGDPEGISTFRWLRNGSTAIAGATSLNYTLVPADLGATINFEVTPVAQSGVTTGSAVASAPTAAVVAANSAPVASAVKISGKPRIGTTLIGSYTYSDADGDPEGTSTFRWIRDGSAVPGAISRRYTLTLSDLNSRLVFEVTPVAQTGVLKGKPARSPQTASVKRK